MEARDALEEAIAGRIDDEPIPTPSRRRNGEHLVMQWVWSCGSKFRSVSWRKVVQTIQAYTSHKCQIEIGPGAFGDGWLP